MPDELSRRGQRFKLYNDRIREIATERAEYIAAGQYHMLAYLHRELAKLRGKIARMPRA